VLPAGLAGPFLSTVEAAVHRAYEIDAGRFDETAGDDTVTLASTTTDTSGSGWKKSYAILMASQQDVRTARYSSLFLHDDSRCTVQVKLKPSIFIPLTLRMAHLQSKRGPG
jgi:hypothetical protein